MVGFAPTLYLVLDHSRRFLLQLPPFKAYRFCVEVSALLSVLSSILSQFSSYFVYLHTLFKHLKKGQNKALCNQK